LREEQSTLEKIIGVTLWILTTPIVLLIGMWIGIKALIKCLSELYRIRKKSKPVATENESKIKI